MTATSKCRSTACKTTLSNSASLADQYRSKARMFDAAARQVVAVAAGEHLASFGIKAARDETGFGYFERGAPLRHAGYKVARSVERSALELAQNNVALGRYTGVGGISAFRAATFLAKLGAYRPAIAFAARATVAAGRAEGRQLDPDGAAVGGFESESVDRAVMGHTRMAAMVSTDLGWSDIGNWDTVLAGLAHDSEGNSFQGWADHGDCCKLLTSADGRRISVTGLDDVIVVVDGDEVLVTARSGALQVGVMPGAAHQ